MTPLPTSSLTVSVVSTEGATIDVVVARLYRQLQGTDLEPEWLNSANFLDNDDEPLYGPKTCRPWPTDSRRGRFAVSICRGGSEGWLVHVDHVGYVGGPPRLRTAVQKLVVCKCLVRRQACAVAEAITKMLDVA